MPLRLYLTGSSFAPLRRPCPGIAFLWLCRGSGRRPLLFSFRFSFPFFSPLLVRCSRKNSQAMGPMWETILAQACEFSSAQVEIGFVCATKAAPATYKAKRSKSAYTLSNYFKVRVVAERPSDAPRVRLPLIHGFAQKQNGRLTTTGYCINRGIDHS